MKFVKVISRQRNPLYGIMYFFTIPSLSPSLYLLLPLPSPPPPPPLQPTPQSYPRPSLSPSAKRPYSSARALELRPPPLPGTTAPIRSPPPLPASPSHPPHSHPPPSPFTISHEGIVVSSPAVLLFPMGPLRLMPHSS